MQFLNKRKAVVFENGAVLTGAINKFIDMRDPFSHPEGVARRDLVSVSIAANDGGIAAVAVYDETREVDDAEIEEWLRTQPAGDPIC